MEIAVGGVAVSVLVRTLVEQFEGLGLPSREAPIAALVSGLVLGLVAAVVAHQATSIAVFEYLAVGVSSGLGAVGVDAGIKRVRGGGNASS